MTASFLATKAHFSSSWASSVRGGDGDQLVAQARRMGPGLAPVVGVGLPIDADELAGLAGAVAPAMWWRTGTASSGDR